MAHRNGVPKPLNGEGPATFARGKALKCSVLAANEQVEDSARRANPQQASATARLIEETQAQVRLRSLELTHGRSDAKAMALDYQRAAQRCAAYAGALPERAATPMLALAASFERRAQFLGAPE